MFALRMGSVGAKKRKKKKTLGFRSFVNSSEKRERALEGRRTSARTGSRARSQRSLRQRGVRAGRVERETMTHDRAVVITTILLLSSSSSSLFGCLNKTAVTKTNIT